MQPITFTTARGAKIEISVETECTAIADRNVTVPCYNLCITANGKRLAGGYDLTPVAGHGECLTPYIGGNPTIPVPEPHLAAVRALLMTYKAEVAARADRDADRHLQRDALIGTSFATEHADEIKINGGRR